MLEKELRAELKTGKLRRAYLLCGEEDYLKRSARAQIRAAVLTDESFSSFNHTVLSAADTPPPHCALFFEMMPPDMLIVPASRQTPPPSAVELLL